MVRLYIQRGLEENIPEAIDNGAIYICTDTHVVYIDCEDQRIKLSGEYAEKLRISEQYTIEDLNQLLTENNYRDKIGTATTSDMGLLSAEDKAKIDTISKSAAERNTWFAVCEDAESQEKTLTTLSQNFELKEGNILFVYFQNGHTADSLSLKIDENNAVPAYIDKDTLIPNNLILEGDVSCFVYTDEDEGGSFTLVRGTLATDTNYGLTRLTNSPTYTEPNVAASALAVSMVYDIAHNALPLAGGQMTGTIGLAPNKVMGGSAIDAEGSDLGNLNGLRFKEVAFEQDEGFVFPRGDQNYDVLRVRNGEVKLLQNVPITEMNDPEYYKDPEGIYSGEDIDNPESTDRVIDGEVIPSEPRGIYDGGNIDGEDPGQVTSKEQTIFHTGNFNDYADEEGTLPRVNGIPSWGTQERWARSDHVHPMQTTISGNAGTASSLQYGQPIDGVLFYGNAGIAHYAVCASAGTTQEKEVTLSNFTTSGDKAGSIIYVKFENTNEATQPSLKVTNSVSNQSFSAPLMYQGMSVEPNQLKEGHTYTLVVDGTEGNYSFNVIGELDTDTTYTTANEALDGLMSAADKKKFNTMLENAGKEADLQWGGTKNPSKNVSPVDAALLEDLSHNRISFMDPTHIIIEYSTTGGSQWTGYSTTSANKINLVTENAKAEGINIGARTSAGTATIQDQLRITIQSGDVVFDARKIAVFTSTNGATGAVCNLEVSSNSDTFTAAGQVNIEEGSQWSVLQVSHAFGTDITAYRLTFKCAGVSDTQIPLSVEKIRMYGLNVKQDPSNEYLVNSNVPYTIDPENGVVSFLKGVKIDGGLSGNAATATKLQTTRTIDGIQFDGTTNLKRYTICNTGAATATKSVDVTGFMLVDGATINVKFTTTNSAAVNNLKLKVGANAEKPIKYSAKQTIQPDFIQGGRVYSFVYDESDSGAFILVGEINTDFNVQQNPLQTAQTTKLPLLLGKDNLTGSAIEPVNYYSGLSAYMDVGNQIHLIAARFDGVANKATTWESPIKINGSTIDGDEGITTGVTTPEWGAARKVTIGNKQVSVNGSQDYSWTHAEIGVPKYVKVANVQTSANRRTVILLCQLTGTASSYSNGRITFHSSGRNAVDYYADISACNNSSNALLGTIDTNCKSTTNKNETPPFIRLCTCTYNSVKYGAIDCGFGTYAYDCIEFIGNTNFAITGVDYYNTSTTAGSALNTEIYNSLAYTYTQTGAETLYHNTKPVIDSGSIGTYAPSLTGTGATGNWSINISGNAATATKATNADNATKATKADSATTATSATTANTASSLATARSLAVNLASELTVVSKPFDGTKNVLDIPTSGILPVTKGGTGYNTQDTTPTSGSAKMVTSGGVYTALVNERPKIVTITFATTEWTNSNSPYTVTKTVTGVKASETAQVIQWAPASDDLETITEAGVLCTGQAENQLTFTCEDKVAGTIYVAIWEAR